MLLTSGTWGSGVNNLGRVGADWAQAGGGGARLQNKIYSNIRKNTYMAFDIFFFKADRTLIINVNVRWDICIWNAVTVTLPSTSYKYFIMFYVLNRQLFLWFAFIMCNTNSYHCCCTHAWIRVILFQASPACVIPLQGAPPSGRRSLWQGFPPRSTCERTGRRTSDGLNPGGSEGCRTGTMSTNIKHVYILCVYLQCQCMHHVHAQVHVPVFKHWRRLKSLTHQILI